MIKIVVDTSVIVDHLRADKGPYIHLLELARRGKVILYLPTVVVVELWRGSSMKSNLIERQVTRLLAALKIIELTKQIAKFSGELLRSEAVRDIVDATVAATALELDAQLATSNEKHFSKVRGLKIFKV